MQKLPDYLELVYSAGIIYVLHIFFRGQCSNLHLFVLLFFKDSQSGVTQHQQGYSIRKVILQYPFHRLILLEQGVHHSGLNLYNKLPKYLKKVKSIDEFKKRLQNFLAQWAFYSLKEYLEL